MRNMKIGKREAKKLETTAQSLLNSLTDEQIAAMVNPCTKLTIVIKVVRGQSAVVSREATYQLARR